MSLTTATCFVAILLATIPHGRTQMQLSCGNSLSEIYFNFRNTFDKDLPTVIPREQQIFICQHMAFHQFISSTETNNRELTTVMDNIIHSLCHLWVSLVKWHPFNILFPSLLLLEKNMVEHHIVRWVIIMANVLYLTCRMEIMSMHYPATQQNFYRRQSNYVQLFSF